MVKNAAIFGSSGAIGAALVQRLADGGAHVWAGSRKAKGVSHPNVSHFVFDLDDEATISSASELMRNDPPDLVVVASGVLTLENGTGPERSYKSLDTNAMARILHLNAIGPALVAKHMLPLLPRNKPAIFAALSARVGSIGDNRLGGWHSYRASKAALNMLIRNFAIELARTHKQAIVAGLHPGTVASALSEPFQSNLPAGQLTTPDDAARHLLHVLDGLTPQHSGKVFDWKGEQIVP